MSTSFLCKGPDSKYFRLCGPHTASRCFSFLSFPSPGPPPSPPFLLFLLLLLQLFTDVQTMWISLSGLLYQSVTNCGLNRRNSLSHNFGGEKSEITVSTGLGPPEGYGGETILYLSPGCCWSIGNLQHSLTCRGFTLISAFLFIQCSSCVSVPISPFCWDSGHTGLGVYPIPV